MLGAAYLTREAPIQYRPLAGPERDAAAIGLLAAGILPWLMLIGAGPARLAVLAALLAGLAAALGLVRRGRVIEARVLVVLAIVGGTTCATLAVGLTGAALLGYAVAVGFGVMLGGTVGAVGAAAVSVAGMAVLLAMDRGGSAPVLPPDWTLAATALVAAGAGALCVVAARPVAAEPSRGRSAALRKRERQAARAVVRVATTPGTSRQQVLEAAAEAAGALFRAGHIELLAPTPDGRSVVMRAGLGWTRKPDRARVEHTGSLAHRVMFAKEPLVIADLLASELVVSLRARHTYVRSLVAAPIPGPHGDAFGALIAYGTAVGQFDSEDGDAMAALAALVGAAVHRPAPEPATGC